MTVATMTNTLRIVMNIAGNARSGSIWKIPQRTTTAMMSAMRKFFIILF